MSDFYKIMIIGSSGRGKTYGAKTLNKKTTGFVNVEDKPLPFKNEFENYARPDSTAKTKAAIMEFAKNPNIDLIVIDSFSAYIDFLIAEARASFKGFDIWNYYNEEIGKFFRYLKAIQKEVIITCHYEMINIEGAPEKRAKVKGKEWEGVIEKEFTIVLYADRKKDDKGVVEAWLDLSLDDSSAKCPPDIFGSSVSKIDSDYAYLFESVKRFDGR